MHVQRDNFDESGFGVVWMNIMNTNSRCTKNAMSGADECDEYDPTLYESVRRKR